MSEDAPAAQPAPTNQGESGLCTRHATGNAIVSAGEKQGINFPLKSAIDVLVNSTADPNVDKGAFPEQFDTSKLMKPLVLQDESTTQWYYVELEVKECELNDYNVKDEFVLVYSVPGGGVHARHCVFIEKKMADKWSCINSWGNANEPRPQISVNKPENVVYKVVVTLRDSQEKDVLAAVKAANEAGGDEAVKKAIEEHLNQWKFQEINIAVTGPSGVGKSTLINTFRGLKGNDGGAAKIGVKETTMKPTKYLFPDNKKIKVWDLPGSGTTQFPKDQYFEKMDELLEEVEPGMKFDRFDALIAMSATRFTETDQFLADHVDVIGKPLFFVRTKIDIDIQNMEEEMDQAPEITLATIREDCEQNLGNISKKHIFYICGKLNFRSRWDYHRLYKHIVNSLEDLQKEALLFSIQAFSEEMVREKKAALESRIKWRNAAWWTIMGPSYGVGAPIGAILGALPAAAGGLAKAVGLKETGDKLLSAAGNVFVTGAVIPALPGILAAEKIMKDEIKFQRKQMGVDKKAVAQLATDTGKTVEEARKIIDLDKRSRTQLGKSEIRPASHPYEDWCFADLYKELTLNEQSALKKLELQKSLTKTKM